MNRGKRKGKVKWKSVEDILIYGRKLKTLQEDQLKTFKI